jgi:hypothetical protein
MSPVLARYFETYLSVRVGMLIMTAAVLAFAVFSWSVFGILGNVKANNGTGDERERPHGPLWDVFRQITTGACILVATFWGMMTYIVWFGVPEFVPKLLRYFWR